MGERRKASALKQLGDAPLSLVTRLPEQPPEELDVLAHAEVGIEVLAEALRHIGDARAGGIAMAGVRHVAVEHVNPAALDATGAGDDAQQG